MRTLSMVLVLVLWSCGSGSDPHRRNGGEVPAFALSVQTPSSSLPLGGKSRVRVQIARTGGFTGPVAISGASLPRGVVVAPATIAPGATSAEILVGATAPLAVGTTVTYSIQGIGEGIAPRAALLTDALVTGKPGSLDTSFGPGTGIARVSFGADDAGRFTALDELGGRVLATGYGVTGLGAIEVATIRFNAAGAVDPTWNGGMLERTKFGTSSNDDTEAFAIGRQADGRSVAIGYHRGSGLGEDIALIRYSLTGGPGGDFGSIGGKGLVDLGGAELVSGGLVQADSSIVAIGTLDGHFMVARMTPKGFLDTSFAAPAGYDRVILGSSSSADAVATDAEGRLVVAGTFAVGGRTELVIRRYTSAGRPDASFGQRGQVIVSGTASERAAGLRMIGDQIAVASTAVEAGATSFRVRRFLASGVLDVSFGARGIAEAPVSAGNEARRMVVLPEEEGGEIVVLGAAGNEALLVRFTRRGQLDPLFGPNGSGKASVFIGENGAPASLEVYPRHRIVLGGGDEGGSPGPGTFGVLARVWM